MYPKAHGMAALVLPLRARPATVSGRTGLVQGVYTVRVVLAEGTVATRLVVE